MRAVHAGIFGLLLALAALSAPGAGADETRLGAVSATCLAAPYAAAEGEAGGIAALVAWLRAALPPGDTLREAFEAQAPELCLAETIFGAEGYLGVEDNRIVLRRTLAPGMIRAVLIHELRHLHQTRLGACPSPALSMQETARVTLAMEADASAVSLAVAWRLREQGDGAVWEALAAWPSHADIAAAFAGEMARGTGVEAATARAFAQWYLSDWRRETYYIAACSAYLDRQDRAHALPRYGAAAADFLQTLCRLPDGRAYPCVAPGAVRQRQE